MELIDAAAESLAGLIAEIAGYQDTVHTEQDTRLKIIDRFLTDILYWPMAEISTEEHAGRGFADYKLTVNKYTRLVVEAKKDERDLGLQNRAGGRPYKIDGPVFTTEPLRRVLNKEYAIVVRRMLNSRVLRTGVNGLSFGVADSVMGWTQCQEWLSYFLPWPMSNQTLAYFMICSVTKR